MPVIDYPRRGSVRLYRDDVKIVSLLAIASYFIFLLFPFVTLNYIHGGEKDFMFGWDVGSGKPTYDYLAGIQILTEPVTRKSTLGPVTQALYCAGLWIPHLCFIFTMAVDFTPSIIALRQQRKLQLQLIARASAVFALALLVLSAPLLFRVKESHQDVGHPEIQLNRVSDFSLASVSLPIAYFLLMARDWQPPVRKQK